MPSSMSVSRSLAHFSLIVGVIGGAIVGPIVGPIGAARGQEGRGQQGAYVAEAILWAPRQTSVGAASQNETADDFRIYCRTQVDLLRSSLVLEKVAEDKAIAGVITNNSNGHPVAAIRSALRVETSGESEIITVRFAAPSAKLAKSICESIVTSYFKTLEELEKTRTQRLIESLNETKKRRKARIAALNQKMEGLVAEPDSAETRAVRAELANEVAAYDKFEQQARNLVGETGTPPRIVVIREATVD